MCQNRRFIVHLTLTFDLKILESDFRQMSTWPGSRDVLWCILKRIRPVNEDAVLYPVLK